MKKSLLMTLSVFGVVSLTSCTWIKNIFDPEKDYSLSNFKTLLAERKVSEEVPYASVKMTGKGTDQEGEKVEQETTYTYDSAIDIWYRNDGNIPIDFVLDMWAHINVIKEVKSISSAKNYTFHARKKEYRIAFVQDEKDAKTEFTWIYGENGFMTSATLKMTDKVNIKSGEMTCSFAYTEK